MKKVIVRAALLLVASMLTLSACETDTAIEPMDFKSFEAQVLDNTDPPVRDDTFVVILR